VSSYASTVQQVFSDNELCIGLFGIGPDGHTAGILPGSTASSETEKLVTGYTGPDYQRITLTVPAIAQLDVAIAYAAGAAKAPALQTLKTEDISVSDQPAQVLKQVPEFFIYSDQFEV
jgi:6-phosphogluconolactonase/glucosamine-6-phosphate isomerase/deaminase